MAKLAEFVGKLLLPRLGELADSQRVLSLAAELLRQEGPGGEAAEAQAAVCRRALEDAGLEEVRHLDFATRRLEGRGRRVVAEIWQAEGGRLSLAGEGGEPLLDAGREPAALIRGSVAPETGALEAEVVEIPDLAALGVVDQQAVRDRFVLTGRFFPLAVPGLVRAGAAGFICDQGCAGDPAARARLSFGEGGWPFWSQGQSLGFSLSRREGEQLRRRLAAAPGLRLRAEVAARGGAGVYTGLTALLRGRREGAPRLLVLGPLGEPGAIAGAAATALAVEALALAVRLSGQPGLGATRRGLQLFLGRPDLGGADLLQAGRDSSPGAVGFFAWGGCAAGGARLLLSQPAAPFFGDTLAGLLLRELAAAGQEWPVALEPAPLSPRGFALLGDPAYGVPGLVLEGGYPQRGTTADRLELAQPEEVRRALIFGAGLAWLMAAVGPADVPGLGELIAAQVAAGGGLEAHPARKARELESLAVLAGREELAQLQEGLDRGLAALPAGGELPPFPADAPAPSASAPRGWESVPLRRRRGLPWGDNVPLIAARELERLPVDPAVLFWADGERDLKQIYRLALLHGQAQDPLALMRFFELMGELGFTRYLKDLRGAPAARGSAEPAEAAEAEGGAPEAPEEAPPGNGEAPPPGEPPLSGAEPLSGEPPAAGGAPGPGESPPAAFAGPPPAPSPEAGAAGAV